MAVVRPATLAEAGHGAVIKPIPLRPAVEAGFTLDDFEIDHASRAVTCPAGVTRTMTATGNVVFGVSCNSCPLKARCTSAKDGRTLHVTEPEALRRAARRQAETPEFQELYRQQRPMVGTVDRLARPRREPQGPLSRDQQQ